MITNTSARPMCNFFFSRYIGTLPPPPTYQKAGYATDEPLTEKKIVSPLRSLPPPPPPNPKLLPARLNTDTCINRSFIKLLLNKLPNCHLREIQGQFHIYVSFNT